MNFDPFALYQDSKAQVAAATATSKDTLIVMLWERLAIVATQNKALAELVDTHNREVAVSQFDQLMSRVSAPNSLSPSLN